MKVIVGEYVTACGLGMDPALPIHSLYREGRAMRDSLAADLRLRPDVELCILEAWPEDWSPLANDASTAFIIIAPEFDGLLLEATRQIEATGAKLLGPSSAAVALTSDKLTLAEHWRSRGIPTPATSERPPSPCDPFPLVWKPRFGAGSTSTFRLDHPRDLPRCQAIRAAEGCQRPMIVQEYVPGLAASVAFLTGPNGHFAMPPAQQSLSNDGRFKYLGGKVPLPPTYAPRAIALAQRAIADIPGLRGWVGVDLVLGHATDGSRDYAIEINPRLTTSYLGLRALCQENLVAGLILAAEGRLTCPPRWHDSNVIFTADGHVDVTPADNPEMGTFPLSQRSQRGD